MTRGQLAGPAAERLTFGDLEALLMGDYEVNGRKSVKRVRQSVKHLRKHFGPMRAADITSEQVMKYVEKRMHETPIPKPATIRYELAALGRMFTLAVQVGRVAIRPRFPSIEVRNTRTGFFEEEDFRRVWSCLPAHVRPLVEFLYLTGWRIGEVRELAWKQIDFSGGAVRLEPGTTKNDEGRTFPFRSFPALHALLLRQRQETTALEQTGRIVPWVFHNAGRPIRDFRVAWQSACRRAGVPGRLVHDLRRTAVRNLERSGVSRSVAMKLTGHKTESVYRRYAIVSEADLADGVRKLATLGVEDLTRSGTFLTQFGAAKGVAGEEGIPNSLPQLVPGAGFEPARGCPQRILSPLRLPFRHPGISCPAQCAGTALEAATSGRRRARAG
jgi:integrase